MSRFVFLFLFTLPLYGQNICGVRYHIKTDALDSLVAQSSSKKLVNPDYKSRMPKYVDYIVANNHMVEVFWNEDSSFSGARIYPSLEENVYQIAPDFVLSKKSNAIIKNISTQQLKDTVISQNVLKAVRFTGESMFPITYFYQNDTLQIKLPQASEYINVEFTFYSKYEVFPLRIVIGAPKIFMSFVAISELSLRTKVDLYSELLTNYKSKRKRKKILHQLQME